MHKPSDTDEIELKSRAASIRQLHDSDAPWVWAKWFAEAAFLIGGSVVYRMSFVAAFPPAPPTGAGSCGLSTLGGVILMVIGTPLGAVSAAIVAGAVGRILDIQIHRGKHKLSFSSK